MVILKLKERVTISLRKKPNFEELVQQNKQQILEDRNLLNAIDEKIEKRLTDSFKRDA
ncbi:FbpB family small basic protein [Aquibacillus halophilus]|uniref:FbpB family small basic protein n=1 Tax=Aquibacillus halophilus TaxID=930132 RepID=UPI00129BE775|nr:FbpB family small basic protein [Aquibacillus halophilus]